MLILAVFAGKCVGGGGGEERGERREETPAGNISHDSARPDQSQCLMII